MKDNLDFIPGRTLWLVVPKDVSQDDAIDADTWIVGKSREVEP